MVAKSDYGKAVVEGLQYVKRYVETQSSTPVFDGQLPHPLADKSVNETVLSEIVGLIKKHEDALS